MLWAEGAGCRGCSLHPLPPIKNPSPLHPQRYFVLENGILKYSTTRQDVSCVPRLWPCSLPGGSGLGTPLRKAGEGLHPDPPGLPQVLKGKLHGAIDVRQSVMSVNKKAQRVDLDTEDNIYHLKVPLEEGWSSDGTGLGTSGPQPTPPCPPDQVPGAVLQLGEQPLHPPPRRAAGAVSPRGSQCTGG